MSQKMGRIWSPHTLLVGVRSGAATLENSKAAPQKLGHGVSLRPNNSTLKVRAPEK